MPHASSEPALCAGGPGLVWYDASCITKGIQQEALPQAYDGSYRHGGQEGWEGSQTMCTQSAFSVGPEVPNANRVWFTLSRGKLLIRSSGCFAGCNMAQKVTQVQSTASRQEGEEVTLDCSYETSQNLYHLFWYKQLRSGEMVFLIRQTSFDSQNQRSGRYSVVFQKSLKSISLVISASQPEDLGKYFCALWELAQCLK